MRPFAARGTGSTSCLGPDVAHLPRITPHRASRSSHPRLTLHEQSLREATATSAAGCCRTVRVRSRTSSSSVRRRRSSHIRGTLPSRMTRRVALGTPRSPLRDTARDSSEYAPLRGTLAPDRVPQETRLRHRPDTQEMPTRPFPTTPVRHLECARKRHLQDAIETRRSHLRNVLRTRWSPKRASAVARHFGDASSTRLAHSLDASEPLRRDIMHALCPDAPMCPEPDTSMTYARHHEDASGTSLAYWPTGPSG